MQDLDLMVEACGTAYAVAEIGEQFAWLGAALQSSSCESGVTCSTPSITKTHVSSDSHKLPKTRLKAILSVTIEFEVWEEDNPGSVRGQCWHDMFHNPVIVQGYPIRRRSEPDTGLELPLNLMAGLMQTRRVNSFNGKLFIKGYSAMLVPVRYSGDLLLWHHIRSQDGQRISYLDNPEPHETNVEISRLEQLRHVVGWCCEAKLNAGRSMS
jgi:hypothetical protein